MYYRPRSRPASSSPPEPTLSQLALAEIKRREEEEAPFGGWAGELVIPRPPEPGVVFQPRPVIPPADWDAEAREREAQEQAAELERARALVKENAPEEPA